MTPHSSSIGSQSMLSALVRWLGAGAIALSMLLPPGAASARVVPSTAPITASTTHVYLLRGVLNIFSLGLDDIAAQLRAQGIPVTVSNFISWSSLADEAAAGYRSGQIKTVILVGHSSGATALPDMIAKLGQLGVPVKLAIGLDSVFKTKLVAGNAERYINFYIANGAGEPVRVSDGFHGKLENVDVHTVPGVGHVTIEKNAVMQQKVIGAIDSVVFSGHRQPALPAVAAGRQRAASAAGLRN
jgi:pimeloyl-ACP methyl ester carboxylesterase